MNRSLSLLKRVWLVTDRQTLVSKMFAFLEFETIEGAENGKIQITREPNKYKDILAEGVDKIEVNFGRDLFALNTHYSPLSQLSLKFSLGF